MTSTSLPTASSSGAGSRRFLVTTNLTGLLARIKPAVTSANYSGDKSSKNAAYVDAVARRNVVLGIETIRRRSPILEALEAKKTITITGAMYDLATGVVEFLG